jgi:guanine deaminase
MDRHSPEYYSERDTSSAIKNIEAFIQEFLKMKFKLVKPILTPRFVPSCSSDLMNKLGELAREHDLHIQSHIC